MRDVIKMQRRTASGLEDVLSFGDIVASGSNANGSWVRWSDGTQICRSTIALTGIDVAETETVWRSDSYTPPAAFTGAYDICITSASGASNGIGIYLVPTYYADNNVLVWNSGRAPANVHPGDAVRGEGTNTIYNVTSATIRVVAIGKWK